MSTLPPAPECRLAPPIAPRDPLDVSLHGDPRTDDYPWMRKRRDPRTMRYLKAENAHAQAWFAPYAQASERLYQELLSRVAQDDESVPCRDGAWWYWTRTQAGLQYPVYLRSPALGTARRFDPTAAPQVLLDLNRLAAGRKFVGVQQLSPSPDGHLLAYTLDETGGRELTLLVQRIADGRALPLRLEAVQDFAWAADSRTLYVVAEDDAKRGHQLWRHDVHRAVDAALLIEEPDELYELGLDTTRDERYLVLSAGSMDANELHLIDAHDPRAVPHLLWPRQPRREYDVEHREGRLYVLTNDTGPNSRLVSVPVETPALADAQELIAHRADISLEALSMFAGHMVVTERARGQLQLRVIEATGADHVIDFGGVPVDVGEGDNAEFDATVFRFEVESLEAPPSTWDYTVATRERVLLKREPVLGGFDETKYASERLTARAADGTEVPVSLVYRRDRRGASPQPLLLYGYGSYGIPSDVWFSSSRLSLLDRGAIFAIAHVRGGGEYGRAWYDAGKMACKMNSFTDFVACAEMLVERGYTTPSQLAIEGGSAGGLLVAAAVNLRPDLFGAVLAEVPFVDVINTMLDETLPLTTGEFIEWGNPKVAADYKVMRAYSPYDNLRPGPYPAMYVRAGLNDSQVAYWEPAKYVARLRTLKTDDRPLLLEVDLEVGHAGASGRYDALREQARSYTFLLAQWGLIAPD